MTHCDFTEKKLRRLQRLWLSLGGKNTNPYARDCYREDGYDDDAAVITDELIAALNRKWPDGVEYFDADTFDEKSISSLSAEDTGHWLVVVDYHF